MYGACLCARIIAFHIRQRLRSLQVYNLVVRFRGCRGIRAYLVPVFKTCEFQEDREI